MAVTLTKRNYATLAVVQAEESAATLAQIALAEQAIDNYIGAQQKHIPNTFRVEPTAFAGSNKTIYDTSNNTQLYQVDGYFVNCVIEIIGGTGAGQVRLITSSDKDDRSVTVTDAWDTAPDTTSFMKIYQLGKFPRSKDVLQNNAGTAYYKSVPDQVKAAVIAQVQFMIAQGDSFFEGDDTSKESESIGDYSYSRGGGAGGSQTSAVRMLGPRARTLLKGFKNSVGSFSAENPTCL